MAGRNKQTSQDRAVPLIQWPPEGGITPELRAQAIADLQARGRVHLSKFDGQPSGVNALIVDINRQQVELFEEQSNVRLRYENEHPTRIACFKCMDGRVHLPTITKTPLGIVKPFRAIGGAFSMFMPALSKRLTGWAFTKNEDGRIERCLAFITYHYSGSDPHLGCAGWKYDTYKAWAHAEQFAAEVAHDFRDQVEPIVIGVDTDIDALTFHFERGDVASIALDGLDEGEVRVRLRKAVPRLDEQMVKDLLPFVLGNVRRLAELRERPRDPSRDLRHLERVIAFGQCFDWLSNQNFALIINDIDPNLDHAVVTAASIIEDNLKVIGSDEDVTLLTNIPYRKNGTERWNALTRATRLMEFAIGHLAQSRPSLIRSGRLKYMIGTTHEPSRQLTVLEHGLVV